MVAYTTPDCLPYFEGTDAPCLNTGTVCDPSTVWCDFAELVEARLTSFDEVIARTAESVPMAWVESTVPTTYVIGTVGSEVQPLYDVVRIDTDSMVNLDEYGVGFTFNQTGIYMLWGWMEGITSTNLGAGQSMSGTFSIEQTPFTNLYGAAGVNEITTSWETFVNDVAIKANIHTVLPVTAAGQQMLSNLGFSGITNDSVTITSMHIGAIWMADLP